MMALCEGGEGFDNFGVAEVEFVEVADHFEVVADDEGDAFPHFIGHGETLHEGVGDVDASFAVPFGALIFAEVVEEED